MSIEIKKGVFNMANTEKKSILMALTRFDIGGAETHVLELSLELQRMGYRIVVVSNGGVYEENLKEAGIKHYKIPLHSKTPVAMAKSLSLLKKVIKEEKIDIVHAHGRIPAFLCGILRKCMRFTFVTTAHWVFDTSHGLKYLSNWGEKVMAVSVDIKKYLMDNYGTNPSDIYVTINGIDTNKFCKTADAQSVIEEFSLSNTSKKIVYISRMDEDRAQVAFELSEIAPELVKLIPDLEIVIVGGGNVYDKLEEKVNLINERIGRRAIILTGARTDIYKFAALGDWFVGVSRSALEAMACEKPAIIAGNEGYIGIFDEDKLKVSIDTNFCCRGLEQSSPELLLCDLKVLMTNTEEENARLGAYGREIILSHYSLSKMAKDCETMYLAAHDPKKWDAVISGYYGYKNSGDETLLFAILKSLREEKEDTRILVLSGNPKETEKMYGVHALNRYHLFKIRKEIGRAKLLIFGGGSLLQDVTSSKSLWYYLTVIRQALCKKTPVMIYANGIGPVNKEKNRKKVRDILNRADKITLRDEASLGQIETMGVAPEKAEVTADPALTLEPCDDARVEEICSKEGIKDGKKLLGVSVRAWKNAKPSYFKELAEAITEICEKHGCVPVLVPLQYPDDLKVSKELKEHLKIESYLIQNQYSAKEMIGIFGKCHLCLAMRLHALIYASQSGVPAIGLSYDPKVSGFLAYVGVEEMVDVERFEKEELLCLADELFENYDEKAESLKKKTEELKILAEKNVKFAMEFIR